MSRSQKENLSDRELSRQAVVEEAVDEIFRQNDRSSSATFTMHPPQKVAAWESLSESDLRFADHSSAASNRRLSWLWIDGSIQLDTLAFRVFQRMS
jgi:hypothetical protein